VIIIGTLRHGQTPDRLDALEVRPSSLSCLQGKQCRQLQDKYDRLICRRTCDAGALAFAVWPRRRGSDRSMTTEQAFGRYRWTAQDFGGSVGPFRAEFTGNLILPIDPEYDSARFVWKGAIKRRPAAIARCSTAREVAATLALGRGQGLEISVRGGGLMIDLSAMRNVTVDPSAAQGGVRRRRYLGGPRCRDPGARAGLYQPYRNRQADPGNGVERGTVTVTYEVEEAREWRRLLLPSWIQRSGGSAGQVVPTGAAFRQDPAIRCRREPVAPRTEVLTDRPGWVQERLRMGG